MAADNTLDLLPWQIAPFEDTSPVVLLTGSAGGGKSRVAYEKAHLYAMRYAGATVLLLRKNRQSMINSTVPYYQGVILADSTIKITHVPSKYHWKYPNGSIVIYGGMADPKQREQIRGIGQKGGIDFCVMEEANAFLEEDFNEVRARMRGNATSWRQIILMTNPDSPSHWIYKRLIQLKQAKVYYSHALDNTTNPKDYIDSLQAISGVQGQRLREGLWVRAEGAVLPEFDISRHVITREYVPRTWRRIRAIDFGYRAPFVCLWIAIDPETDNRYVYRELYQTELLVQDAAKIILSESRGEEIETTICDHDPENYGQLERYGILTQPAFKEIIPGIDHLKTLFSQDKILYCSNALLKEDPALVQTYSPTSLIQEIPLYTYAKHTELTEVKEIPVKKNDHGIDALRYAMAYLDDLHEEIHGNLRDLLSLNEGVNVGYKDRYRI